MAQIPIDDPVDRILAYLAQQVSFDEAQRQLIRKVTRIEHYRKGTRLLAQGSRTGPPSATPPRSTLASYDRWEWGWGGGAASIAG